MNIVDESAARVSEFWGDEKKDLRKHNWVEHPIARACINERISGDPNVGTAEHWRRKFLQVPAKLALSIGCGFGNFERAALGMGLAERLDAIDISEKAIKQARAYAAEQDLADRINYAVSDLNNAVLPTTRYDAIFGIASVHHVKGLESLFHQCRQALKPGGLLFMDEYIGPSRFQSKPNVVAIINKMLRILPERYRLNVFAKDTPKDFYVNPPISWFEEFDPSESVRSDEILTVLATKFEIVEIRPWGGTILHMLLAGTAGNFDPGQDSDAALIRIMALMEETLEEAGVIAPDFAAIVARPRSF